MGTMGGNIGPYATQDCTGAAMHDAVGPDTGNIPEGCLAFNTDPVLPRSLLVKDWGTNNLATGLYLFFDLGCSGAGFLVAKTSAGSGVCLKSPLPG